MVTTNQLTHSLSNVMPLGSFYIFFSALISLQSVQIRINLIGMSYSWQEGLKNSQKVKK